MWQLPFSRETRPGGARQKHSDKTHMRHIMHAQILADTDAVAGILRQTRSRPRKWENATRRSQRLRVSFGIRGGVQEMEAVSAIRTALSPAGMGRLIRAAGHDAPGISQKPEAEVRCCVMAGRTPKIDRTPAGCTDMLLFCRRFGIITLYQWTILIVPAE